MGHASQDFISDVACQHIPALRTCQLRRSPPNMLNTRTDIDDHGLDLVGGFVSEPENDGVDSAVVVSRPTALSGQASLLAPTLSETVEPRSTNTTSVA